MSNFENVSVLNELTSATPTPDLAELQTLPCCERPEVGIHWNAGMHHRIVERAKEGIEALQNDPRIGTYATAIVKSWDARSTSILKAIDDADWHAPSQQGLPTKTNSITQRACRLHAREGTANSRLGRNGRCASIALS